MGTCNEIRINLTCPRCNGTTIMQVELHLGDTRSMMELSLGDMYPFVPNKAPQNGGRPEGGNIDGEGYVECPLCEKDFFVKAIVRNSILQAIEVDVNKKPYLI